jgi:hypothetical protein
MSAIMASLASLLIAAQLPTTPPPTDSPGWPGPTMKAAITYDHIGLTPIAQAWAEQLWRQRDPETGLWVNFQGQLDTVNPFWAVMLYRDLGQHERALETYRNHAALARSAGEMPFNAYWWPVVAALMVGEPLPMDLFVQAAPGFAGRYSASEEPDDHGRYYSDQMAAWWTWAGGPKMPYYSSPWCGRRTDWLKYGQAECRAQMAWRNGEPWPVVIDRPFDVYNDEVLMLAALP